MKKLAAFITKYNIVILIVMIILCIGSAVLIPKVEKNSDMTKYLADDSSMKQGIDIMSEELDTSGTTQSVRVMFENLGGAEKEDIQAQLEAIEYVDSVDYEADSEDYNKEQYTLYVVNTEYDYDSAEETSIENTIKTGFPDYTMTYKNDDTSRTILPIWVIALALSILLAILVIMSNSWIEPVLFVITIGIAVVINMGTNLILGSVSTITFSIGAILQLVLSMDYSIILMNRYRQEYRLCGEKKAAMQSALSGAFSSVAGSALTTIVGLLMLVFMSFKIGFDLGVVMAKGVLISMICVFTVLPGLTMLFSGLVFKTEKKTPDIPMFRLSGGIFRLRYMFLPIFLILFIGAYFLQNNTQIVYTAESDDPIADIFPTSNSIVMLYNNEDEDKIADLVTNFEDDENISDFTSYPTLLGMPYTADEMADKIETMTDGTDIDISADLLSILYYDYFSGDNLPKITASDLIYFIADHIAANDTFTDYIGEDLTDNIEQMKKFADADQLITPKNAAQLADFFGMDESDLKSLLLFYFIENDGVDTGSMTLPAFADFVVNEIANDPDYASFFDSDTLSQMQSLLTYTDAEAMTTKRTWKNMASLLGMDSDSMKLLYVYYYSQQSSYTPSSMTVPAFVDLLCNDIANNSTFASQFDSSTLSRMKVLQNYTNTTTIQTQMSADKLASYFGMSSSDVTSLLMLQYMNPGSTDVGTMTLNAFVNFAINDLASNSSYAGMFDESTINVLQSMIENMDETALSTEMDYTQLAGTLQMDANTMYQIFLLYKSMYGDTSDWTMSPVDFINYLLDDIASDSTYSSMLDSSTVANLTMVQTIMNASIAGTKYSCSNMASMFGMDASIMKMLYTYGESSSMANSWKLSVQTVVNFIVDNQSLFGSMLGNYLSELTLAQKVINGSIAGTGYTANALASLLGMDSDQARQLYLLYISCHGDTSGWKISVQQLVDFILTDVLTDEDYASLIDADTADELDTAKVLIDAVVSGKSYTAAQMANMLSGFSDDLDKDTMELLYLYYGGVYDSDPEWKLSLHEIFNYMADDLVNDPRFSAMIDDDMRENIADIQSTLEDAIKQMKGENYSILLISSIYPEESDETTAFIESLIAYSDDSFDGDYYLIGNSPMVYEMQQGFQKELRFITILTAIAIFIVVAITFRSLIIPLILVLVVQCGVYITITVCGLLGYDIHYLALLVVQCILMGATIDYGILFTNYYRENRQKLEKKEALTAAYKGAGHTIQTSGLIMILVTGIIGLSPADPTITQICLTLAIGVTAAVLLIVLVLPGILLTADRLVSRKER